MKCLAALAIMGWFFSPFQDKKQADPDKTKKLSAAQIVSKCVDTMNALKGFHYSMEVSSPNASGKFQGIQRIDATYAKAESSEIYSKQTQYLLKTSAGAFVPSMDPAPSTPDWKTAAAFRNPWVQLREFKSAPTCEGKGDEAVNGVECRKIEVALSDQQKKDGLKETRAKVKQPVNIDPEPFIDFAKTVTQYTVWVGKVDLRLYKLTFHMKGEPKSSLPPVIPPQYGPDTWKSDITIECSKFDAELDWKIPAEVQGKLGIR